MNPIAAAADLDQQKIAFVLTAVHTQLVTALWLSSGEVLAIVGLICVAFGTRRPALLCGLGYSITLCFVNNGPALILGVLGCVASTLGFLWRQFFRIRGRFPSA
jgi:hypothetical protein